MLYFVRRKPIKYFYLDFFGKKQTAAKTIFFPLALALAYQVKYSKRKTLD